MCVSVCVCILDVMRCNVGDMFAHVHLLLGKTVCFVAQLVQIHAIRVVALARGMETHTPQQATGNREYELQAWCESIVASICVTCISVSRIIKLTRAGA